MAPFWILLELRMLGVVVTTGAIRRVFSRLIAPDKSQNVTTNKPTPRMLFLLPIHQRQSTEGREKRKQHFRHSY